MGPGMGAGTKQSLQEQPEHVLFLDVDGVLNTWPLPDSVGAMVPLVASHRRSTASSYVVTRSWSVQRRCGHTHGQTHYDNSRF